MNAAYSNPMIIDKNEIDKLHFPAGDVLLNQDDRKQRMVDLEQATKLGNIEHGKLRIVFADEIGVKLVETTIWGVTDNRIILKSGIVIPINRIHEVKI